MRQFKQCYKCGNFGHVRRQCTENKRIQADMTREAALNLTPLGQSRNKTVVIIGEYVLNIRFVNVSTPTIIVRVTKNGRIVFYRHFP